MHLLICSEEFDAGAEGICTGRVVRALLEAGCRVTVATSDQADCSFAHPNLSYLVAPLGRAPAVLLGILGRLTGSAYAHFFWCRRVAKLSSKAGNIELIYGRSMPISGVEAARLAAKRLGVPFWAHLSDRYPNSWEDPQGPRFARKRAFTRRLAEQAEALTFTTWQGLRFQERCLAMDLTRKAFVLNHIAPEPTWLASATTSPAVFAYVGSFYGKRNAHALLTGFSQYLKTHSQSRFVFVGSQPDSVLPEARRLGILDAVQLIPRVKDVRPYLQQAHALVALDSAQGEPVFMATKVVEYLVVDRPVLLISPETSPAADLGRRFDKSVLRVRPEDPDSISVGLTKILELKPTTEDYARRFQQMEEFSARAIAARFLHEASKRRTWADTLPSAAQPHPNHVRS